MASYNYVWPIIAGIDTLDNDSLGVILDNLAYIDPPGKLGARYVNGIPVRHYNLGWIKSTHVCRRWRMVALAKTSLWANCVSNLPHVFPSMLNRAKEAPLTVKMEFVIWEKNMVRYTDTLRMCIGNVRSLRVTLPTGPERDKLRSVLTDKPLPRLVDLHLRIMGTSFTFTKSHLDRVPCIDAPRLVTLALSNIQCHVRAGRNLRSLSITNDSATWSSADEILVMLREHPQMEVLRLFFNPVPFSDESSAGQPAVDLPHLKLLCVSCTTLDNGQRSGDIHSLLAALSFPTSCTFHYSDFSQRGDDMHWRPAFDISELRMRELDYNALTVSASSGSFLGPPFVANVFSTEDGAWPSHHDHPDEWRSRCCTDDTFVDWNVAPGVSLAVSSIRLWKTEDLLSNFIPRLRCEDVTHLTLRGLSDARIMDFPGLRTALRPLTAVRSLYLPMRFHPTSLWPELATPIGPTVPLVQPPPTTSATFPDERPSLPALRRVIIHQENMYTECSEEDMELWWSALFEWLRRRKQPLKLLQLMGDWRKMRPALQSLDESKLSIAKGLVEELHDERVLPWRVELSESRRV